MSFFEVLVSNPIMNACFVAWFSAQFIKTLLYWAVTRRFRAERILGSGGMPSSHTATVAALCIALARQEGYHSPIFALAMIFAAVVISDALGVRRAAGEHARLLNQMRFDYTDMRTFFLSMVDESEGEAEGDGCGCERGAPAEVPFSGERLLKEFLGHTPLEVLAGAILGVLTGTFYPL